MPRPLIVVAFIVSVLAFVYSLLGVMMAYWVAAVPGNTPEHIRLNFLVWVPASVVTLLSSAGLAVRLAR